MAIVLGMSLFAYLRNHILSGFKPALSRLPTASDLLHRFCTPVHALLILLQCVVREYSLN